MRRKLFPLTLSTVFVFVSCATQTPGRSYQAYAAYRKGLDAGRQGQFKEALDHLETAVKLEPQFAEAWFNLGVGYEKLKEWDHALYAYQRAVEEDPQFLEARMGLAERIESKGFRKKATEEYLKILSADQSNGTAHFKLGLLYDAEGNTDQARSSMEKAVARSPHTEEGYLWLGKDAGRRGQWEKALAFYFVVASLNPMSEGAHEGVLGALKELRQTKRANAWKKWMKVQTRKNKK